MFLEFLDRNADNNKLLVIVFVLVSGLVLGGMVAYSFVADNEAQAASVQIQTDE